MIVLSVISDNGDAAAPIEASFDELGGTIGRADGNLLVLPDPLRMISRVAAQVAHRGGGFVIEDRSSNPILVNGEALGRGRERPLAAGDVVQIGSYRIAVRGASEPAVAVAAAPVAAHIPTDWDGRGRGSTDTRPAVRVPAPASAGAAAPAAESIDAIFGLGDAATASAAQTQASTSVWGEDDVFGFLESGAAPGDALVQDGTVASAPSTPPMPATARRAAGGSIPAPAATPTPAAAAAADAPRRAPVVSWDDAATRQALVVAPAVPAARAAVDLPPSVGSGLQAPAARATPLAPVVAADDDALLRALLEGLRAAGEAPPITSLTPELMRRMGSLLAEAVRGTVDLLQARAAVKREVRAEVTAIRPQQNNAIKFSPTAAVALQYLLGPRASGFMPSEAAMRDAFDDLRAHELAVMAGMRAALTGLLQRFDPRQLETQITARSKLGSLLAGGRRAQLWEAYQQLFAQLRTEAEDDFHEVFGRAFLAAYEDQLEALQQNAPAPGGG